MIKTLSSAAAMSLLLTSAPLAYDLGAVSYDAASAFTINGDYNTVEVDVYNVDTMVMENGAPVGNFCQTELGLVGPGEPMMIESYCNFIDHLGNIHDGWIIAPPRGGFARGRDCSIEGARVTLGWSQPVGSICVHQNMYGVFYGQVVAF